MPIYEYHCDKCDREITLTLMISQHEKGKIECPKCGSKALRPLLSAFMSQTSEEILIRGAVSEFYGGVECTSADLHAGEVFVLAPGTLHERAPRPLSQ